MINNLKSQRGISTIIIVAIVAVLAVGGIGTYVATDGFGSKNTEQTNSETNQESSDQVSEQQPTGSSVELVERALSSGEDVKCTYDEDGNSGTAYIDSEKRFRVDYKSPDGSGHLIYTNDTMYIWSDGESQGFKIENPEEKSEEFSDQYDEFSPENLKDNYSEENLECETFAFTDDLAKIPSDVDFKSFEEMFQNLQ